MASISMRRVQKAYGDHAPVIRDVDLEIGAHEFCVFLGPSGCGKSTLLRMIAGAEDLSAGESIDGRRVDDVPAAERGVAMVFQSYALFPHMTVYENMAFGLKLARVPKAEIDRKVRDAARILQLDTLLDRKPKALSADNGSASRSAAQSCAVSGVFLFDEPLSNLDAALRGQTRIEIAKLHRQFERASVVYVTHDQTEAMTLADKIVLLHAGADTAQHGSIAQVGAPLDLYHHPASRFVAGFIGSPRMNFLPAVVTACDAHRTTVTLTPSGETFVLPRDGSALGAGTTVTLGIRPEHLTLGAAHDATALARDVALVERLGEQTYVHLDQPGGHSIIAKVPGDAQVRSGERVRVY